MFKSLRISKTGLVAAVCAAVAAAVIVSVSAQVCGAVSASGGSFEARERFAAQYGWRLSENQKSALTVVLGGADDRLSDGYAELMQSQKMDIGSYIGRTVQMYAYEVLNFSSGVEAIMTVFEYDGRIFAAHISTADGCIYGLDGQKSDLNTK